MKYRNQNINFSHTEILYDCLTETEKKTKIYREKIIYDKQQQKSIQNTTMCPTKTNDNKTVTHTIS